MGTVHNHIMWLKQSPIQAARGAIIGYILAGPNPARSQGAI